MEEEYVNYRPLPEDTVFTQVADRPEVQEMLKKVSPPIKGRRVRPYVLFLAARNIDPLSRQPEYRNILCMDVSGVADAEGKIRDIVIKKGWPIVGYRLKESKTVIIGQNITTTVEHHGSDDRDAALGLRATINALCGPDRQMYESKISTLEAQLAEHEKANTTRKVPSTNADGETETPTAKRGRPKKTSG